MNTHDSAHIPNPGGHDGCEKERQEEHAQKHCQAIKHDRQEVHNQAREKYGKAAEKRVESAVHRYKKGTLKSGKGGAGGKVKSREQAIAIGLSEAREKGAKVPRKRTKASK